MGLKCWFCKRTEEELKTELFDEDRPSGEWIRVCGIEWELPICIGCEDILISITTEFGFITQKDVDTQIKNLTFKVSE